MNLTIWSTAAAVCLLGGVGAALGSPAHKNTASHVVPTATASAGVTGAPSSPGDPVSSVTPSASAAVATESATTSTPAPVDTTGGAVVNAAGAVLPDPARTPGAINPAVTQADIDSTICVSGWTATVRPPSSYTTALKERQLASGYAYHGDTATADYEEDHLISLEIGGSPDSELNLWPEPYNVPDGARVKDTVENKLHTLVCSHAITLATAQQAIAANWWYAYVQYVGTTASVTTTHAAVPATSHPAPPPASSAAAVPLSCTVTMTNASPAQYSTTDAVVHTAAGAGATATAHYKSTNTSHSGTAGPDGVVDLPFAISRATVGYPVVVDVVVSRAGASASCSTSFTPH